MEEKSFEKFLSEMAKVKDEHLHIMRGHLLIEEKLRELINAKAKKPKALSDARLTFNQVLCIAEALYWKKDSDWLWESIRQLNNIRNSFSHQLTPKKYKDMVKEFLGISKPEPEEFDIKTNLILAMSFIYRRLDKYIKKPKSL